MGVGDLVKVETKRLFQSSWLRDFSCSKFDKDLTGAYYSQCLTNESMANGRDENDEVSDNLWAHIFL